MEHSCLIYAQILVNVTMENQHLWFVITNGVNLRRNIEMFEVYENQGTGFVAHVLANIAIIEFHDKTRRRRLAYFLATINISVIYDLSKTPKS